MSEVEREGRESEGQGRVQKGDEGEGLERREFGSGQGMRLTLLEGLLRH